MNNREYFWLAFGLLVFIISIYFIYKFIGLIMVSLFLYYSARPVYNKTGNYIKNKNLRSLISILTFVIPFLLIISYTILIFISDLYSFTSNLNNNDVLMNYIPKDIISQITLLKDSLTQDPERFINTISNSVSQIFSSVGLLFNTVFYIIIILIIVFYLLRDDVKLVDWFSNNFEDKIPYSRNYLETVDKELKSIYFGNMLTILVVAIISSFTFFAYNIIVPQEIAIRYPFLIGVLCGISSILPTMGIKIVYIPLFTYLISISFYRGLGSLFWIPLIALIYSIIVIDFIPETFIRPYISNRTMHLGLVILSYLSGVLIFGWYGLFLGPLLLSIIYHFNNVIIEDYFNNIS